ncbi:polyprenyl synthetase family protein [Streptomyces sparsus]
MTTTLTDGQLEPAAIREAVTALLARFLEARHRAMPCEPLAEAVGELRDLVLAGGKRIRPLMCLCGWHAAGAHGDAEAVLRVAAALELFHGFALVHDDVMDDSATRRGRPTVHRSLARNRRHRRSGGDAGRFGRNAAILVGDLALAWSDEMLHTARLDAGQLAGLWPLLDRMREELVLGQYLDLDAAGDMSADLHRALAICRHKTAKYTIERPLHIGAALSGGKPAVLDACTAYAIPLGEAFQLRDDLLGVFGTPSTTGKPADDDLRDGKCTVLMAVALARSGPDRRSVLRAAVGRPALSTEQAEEVRAVFRDTGALGEVERMIENRLCAALRALDEAPFPAHVVEVLRTLAGSASRRTS